MPEQYCPIVFNDMISDGEHAYVFICESCASKLGVKTSDTCGDGQYVCHCVGCENNTNLVHYVWDYRPGVNQ